MGVGSGESGARARRSAVKILWLSRRTQASSHNRIWQSGPPAASSSPPEPETEPGWFFWTGNWTDLSTPVDHWGSPCRLLLLPLSPSVGIAQRSSRGSVAVVGEAPSGDPGELWYSGGSFSSSEVFAGILWEPSVEAQLRRGGTLSRDLLVIPLHLVCIASCFPFLGFPGGMISVIGRESRGKSGEDINHRVPCGWSWGERRRSCNYNGLKNKNPGEKKPNENCAIVMHIDHHLRDLCHGGLTAVKMTRQ